jgi:phosphohistidine phosphatase
MRLYLMQHGHSSPGETDSERSLTEDGRAQVERVAAFLARSAPTKHGRVFHSGKTRARQTAEILTSPFPHLQAEQSDGLAPMDDPAVWAERAGGLEEAVALVGHLPHLARLASLLLSGDAESPVVSFTNGGMVCLNRDVEGRWTLRWSVVPSLLE